MAIRKTSVDNYMVRIYRRGQGQSLVGVVELPVREKQVPFQKFEELQAIDAGSRDGSIDDARARRSLSSETVW